VSSSQTPRILVDESLPVELADELGLPFVRTVRSLGWSSLKNGDLIQRAVLAGFTLFLTADQNLEFQQNIHSTELGVIVLRGGSRILDIRALIPSILTAITLIEPGRVMRLGPK
jgi:hypothetical protein